MINKNISDINKIWVVILAAGKGKRINAKKDKNKVAYKVDGVPMITRTINIVKSSNIKNIIVVVGFAKESVLKLLDKDIKTVEQKKRLGTGHALKIALQKIPKSTKYVFVLQGDDSFLYSDEILNKVFKAHVLSRSKLTFLTTEVNNSTGLGRIVRDELNNIIGIVEEKDATVEQKKIKEINTACYIFSYDFLKEYINKISKSKVTGEYYLPYLIDLAILNKEKIEAYKINNIKWRGINTQEELREAEKIISSNH